MTLIFMFLLRFTIFKHSVICNNVFSCQDLGTTPEQLITSSWSPLFALDSSICSRFYLHFPPQMLTSIEFLPEEHFFRLTLNYFLNVFNYVLPIRLLQYHLNATSFINSSSCGLDSIQLKFPGMCIRFYFGVT